MISEQIGRHYRKTLINIVKTRIRISLHLPRPHSLSLSLFLLRSCARLKLRNFYGDTVRFSTLGGSRGLSRPRLYICFRPLSLSYVPTYLRRFTTLRGLRDKENHTIPPEADDDDVAVARKLVAASRVHRFAILLKFAIGVTIVRSASSRVKNQFRSGKAIAVSRDIRGMHDDALQLRNGYSRTIDRFMRNHWRNVPKLSADVRSYALRIVFARNYLSHRVIWRDHRWEGAPIYFCRVN